jgi:hypothetical protein
VARTDTHIDCGLVAEFSVVDPPEARRELAHRSSDGIEVTLLWCACHDTVAVQVSDPGRDNPFEVVVPREHALDAFYHPYAYAADQGLDYELRVLRAA